MDRSGTHQRSRRWLSTGAVLLLLLVFPATTLAFDNSYAAGERELGDTYSGIQGDLSVNQPAFNQPFEVWAANHVAMIQGNALVETGHEYQGGEHFPYWSWKDYNTGELYGTNDLNWPLNAGDYMWYALYPDGNGHFTGRVCYTYGSGCEWVTEYPNYTGSFSHIDMGGEAAASVGTVCTNCAIGYWSVLGSSHSPQFLESSNLQWYTYCPAAGWGGSYDGMYTVNIFDENVSQIFTICDGAGHWTGSYH